jgi:AraC family transcriptional regulator
MSDNRSLIINPADLEELAQTLPCVPTLNSIESKDYGFLLFHYEQQPAHEVPEYVMDYHVIAIWGTDSQAYLESTLDDRTNRGMFGWGANGIIPAGYSHRAVWDQEISLTVLFLHPTLLNQVANDQLHRGQLELIPQHDTHDPVLSQLGQLLRLDLAAGHPSGRLYRESIATAFAARLVSHHTVCPLPVPSISGGLSSQRLQVLMNYIHEYLSQELRLSDLAQLVDLSEYYLCRLFKQSLGISLHQYVIQQRLARAQQLLRRNDLSIAYIAQECGFNSHSHLTQHFRKAFGVSPQVFRAQDFDRN